MPTTEISVSPLADNQAIAVYDLRDAMSVDPNVRPWCTQITAEKFAAQDDHTQRLASRVLVVPGEIYFNSSSADDNDWYTMSHGHKPTDASAREIAMRAAIRELGFPWGATSWGLNLRNKATLAPHITQPFKQLRDQIHTRFAVSLDEVVSTGYASRQRELQDFLAHWLMTQGELFRLAIVDNIRFPASRQSGCRMAVAW